MTSVMTHSGDWLISTPD